MYDFHMQKQIYPDDVVILFSELLIITYNVVNQPGLHGLNALCSLSIALR